MSVRLMREGLAVHRLSDRLVAHCPAARFELAHGFVLYAEITAVSAILGGVPNRAISSTRATAERYPLAGGDEVIVHRLSLDTVVVNCSNTLENANELPVGFARTDWWIPADGPRSCGSNFVPVVLVSHPPQG